MKHADSEDKTLDELTEIYVLRCEVEGKTPRTVQAYRETLGRFLRIAADEGFPTDASAIRPEHLYTYLGRYSQHSFETRHRYFREVRCFSNWLSTMDANSENPFRSLKNVRLPQRIVVPFSANEIARLLAACDIAVPVGARDYAMLLTLLDTGIRCSELVQLTIGDVDLNDGRLRILHPKGNKQRVVSFAGRCREALEQYLYLRGITPGPLFPASSRHGQLRGGVALKPNGLKQMLRRLAKRTGIVRVHAHRFRHTFATWAIEQDARELDVQHLLGHASPDMVRRYASTYNSEQAARRHAAFSPAALLPSGV